MPSSHWCSSGSVGLSAPIWWSETRSRTLACHSLPKVVSCHTNWFYYAHWRLVMRMELVTERLNSIDPILHLLGLSSDVNTLSEQSSSWSDGICICNSTSIRWLQWHLGQSPTSQTPSKVQTLYKTAPQSMHDFITRIHIYPWIGPISLNTLGPLNTCISLNNSFWLSIIA